MLARAMEVQTQNDWSPGICWDKGVISHVRSGECLQREQGKAMQLEVAEEKEEIHESYALKVIQGFLMICLEK